ncbi:hypothetical protein Plec18167_002021 [Paecilomyces lecythidis]|uniref:Major facilitator superfamily (MFS) profile domain-containing protein n=1 Tax=Paecilomyces lecythidis TaxID=3004212 RepID=A0ABR3Y8N3_9EURO
MATRGQKVRFLITASVGFLSDGYLNLTIGLVVPIIGYLYFPKGSVPATNSDIMKGSLSLGMVVGQFIFGILGDAWGRHAIYGKELILTLFGTLMTILLPWNGLSTRAITAWVAVFRVVTGIGIGADYPMSSTLAAEKTPLGSRSVQVLTVFSAIGLGNISASIIFLILLKAFESSVATNVRHLEWVWRLLLGIGMVPAALTLYARLTMPESAPYRKYVISDESKGAQQTTRGLKEQWQDFFSYFREWKHARILFATAASWFLFDIAYYGINLNQSIILERIGYATGPNPWSKLYHIAIGNIIVQAAGYLPGFYIGIPLPDLVGRVRQQLFSCVAVCALYAIWAGVSSPSVHTSTGGLTTIFTLSQLVLNLGPNVTTFLIPTEVFPTRVRGTAHGISAAAGKCGAVLTSFAFGTVEERIGLSGVLGLFSGVMALTAVVTLLIPETKGYTLEDIENEVLFGQKAPSGTIEAAFGSPADEPHPKEPEISCNYTRPGSYQ